jgi:hypothetical protein
MPIFKPTARVRVQLRIDELDETRQIRASLEREPPKGAAFGLASIAGQTVDGALNENLQKRTQLESIRGTLPAPQLERERSQLNQERALLQKRAAGGEAQDQPQSLVEKTEDERNVLFSCLPIQATVSRNGLKDADTATVTLDFRDIPIDPRVVRSALISIAIGTVEADQWADGVVRQKARDTDGSLMSLVERAPGEELQFNSPTTFLGYVDEWLAEWGEDGDVLKLQCRDVSALLRDRILRDGAGIDLNVPIDKGVQALIDQDASMRGLKVQYGTPINADDPLNTFAPEDAPIPAKSIPEVLKPRKGKQPKAKRETTEESVWDHITGVCGKLGLIPLFRGFTLFLAEPRVLFSSFLGARRMVWGRNISKLTFARKLGGVKADTIEVRCPDPSIGRTRWARWPVVGDEPKSGILGQQGSPQPVTTRATDVSPNGTGSETVRTMTVRGVTDQKVLERIARNTFEEIARQEIEGAVETDEIESFDTKVQGDLLLLQPGEPVTIEIAPPADLAPPEAGLASSQRSLGLQAGATRSTTGSNLQELQAQSAAKRAAYLRGLGMSKETAQRLAAAQEQAALVTTFRAGNVNINWSADDGVSMDFDFYNFVVVRESPDEASQQPAASTLAEAASAASGSLAGVAGRVGL